MSKLDNIVLNCVKKALDGKENKLGDYIDPTKNEIKELILGLITEDQATHTPVEQMFARQLRKKVEEL